MSGAEMRGVVKEKALSHVRKVTEGFTKLLIVGELFAMSL